jgi:hypothetical protein
MKIIKTKLKIVTMNVLCSMKISRIQSILYNNLIIEKNF